MNRTIALQYLGGCVDDALCPRDGEPPPADARLIGWQCGFEPMFIAVWSYLGIRLDDDAATEIATDYLDECGWFADEPTEPDYII